MSIFRFKRFSIDQTGCAMRINTDGVLLAAFARAEDAASVLDIGTGTGVVALMLAQRFVQAKIVGVEIDGASAAAAMNNALQSPFSNRVQIWHGAFQDFAPQGRVDLIVSNPPFYINTLHNPDARKKQARHTDMTFFDDLLGYAHRHLSQHGAIELILPSELADVVISSATAIGFALQRIVAVSSFVDSPCIRHIIRLGAQQDESLVKHVSFVIYESRGVYSQAYTSLLRDFFLAF